MASRCPRRSPKASSEEAAKSPTEPKSPGFFHCADNGRNIWNTPIKWCCLNKSAWIDSEPVSHKKNTKKLQQGSRDWWCAQESRWSSCCLTHFAGPTDKPTAWPRLHLRGVWSETRPRRWATGASARSKHPESQKVIMACQRMFQGRTKPWTFCQKDCTFIMFYPFLIYMLMHFLASQTALHFLHTWFASMHWTKVPLVKCTAVFWLSPLPSPRMGYLPRHANICQLTPQQRPKKGRKKRGRTQEFRSCTWALCDLEHLLDNSHPPDLDIPTIRRQFWGAKKNPLAQLLAAVVSTFLIFMDGIWTGWVLRNWEAGKNTKL